MELCPGLLIEQLLSMLGTYSLQRLVMLALSFSSEVPSAENRGALAGGP